MLKLATHLKQSQHKMEKSKKVNQRFLYFPQQRLRKKASLLQETIIHLVLIVLIFGLFFFATAGRVGTKDVKQQVLEKQIALLIDSAEEGMSFTVYKVNSQGFISDLKIEEGKVFVFVSDQKVSKGYPYFSKYFVSVEFVDARRDVDDKYIISVKK